MDTTNNISVSRDDVDNRDRLYAPTLRPLRPTHYPSADDKPLNLGMLAPLVRSQGTDGSCTGQALAMLVDLLRLQKSGQPQPLASARMLFEMAKLLASEANPKNANGEIHSLRTVIKGFYHNGVCLDNDWPYLPNNPLGELTLTRSRAARNITLGAYYRVRPQLNDFHSAINEVGGLYVSAALHPGWDQKRVTANRGVITPDIGQGLSHAFVIVGYTAEGFLVLNSWGLNWGGFENLPGIALWLYQDWAASIFDAWALSLGVPAPAAFEFSFGEQGLGLRGMALRASTPRIEVIGHYQHLDDGRRVVTGNYPSPKAGFKETVAYLADSGYRHVLLRFGHGQEDLPTAMTRIARSKTVWKRYGVYPLSLLWANDILASALSCFQTTAREAARNIDTNRQELVRTLNQRLKGLGRAVWRDLQRAAATAATKNGAARDIVTQLMALNQAKGIQLHLLAEGEGALLLAAVMRELRKMTQPSLLDSVQTLTLIYPAIERMAASRDFDALLAALRNKTCPFGQPRAVLYRPSLDVERIMTTGDYPGPWLDLVASFLTSDPRAPARLLGQASERQEIEWNTVEIGLSTGSLTSTDLFEHRTVFDGLVSRIGESTEVP